MAVLGNMDKPFYVSTKKYPKISQSYMSDMFMWSPKLFLEAEMEGESLESMRQRLQNF